MLQKILITVNFRSVLAKGDGVSHHESDCSIRVIQIFGIVVKNVVLFYLHAFDA